MLFTLDSMNNGVPPSKSKYLKMYNSEKKYCEGMMKNVPKKEWKGIEFWK